MLVERMGGSGLRMWARTIYQGIGKACIGVSGALVTRVIIPLSLGYEDLTIGVFMAQRSSVYIMDYVSL